MFSHFIYFILIWYLLFIYKRVNEYFKIYLLDLFSLFIKVVYYIAIVFFA